MQTTGEESEQRPPPPVLTSISSAGSAVMQRATRPAGYSPLSAAEIELDDRPGSLEAQTEAGGDQAAGGVDTEEDLRELQALWRERQRASGAGASGASGDG